MLLNGKAMGRCAGTRSTLLSSPWPAGGLPPGTVRKDAAAGAKSADDDDADEWEAEIEEGGDEEHEYSTGDNWGWR